MLTLLKRLLFAALLLAAFYYGSRFLLTYRFAVLSQECTPASAQSILEDKQADEVTKLRVTAQSFVCVANKQNFIDRLFFDARKFFDQPEKWPFPIDEYKQQIKN